MKKFLLILLTLWSLLLYGVEDNIVIVNTTDTHATLQNCQIIWQLRSSTPEAIFIDCGDVMQGSLDAMRGLGQRELQVLSDLNYDVFVPGNHDFEYGSSALLGAIKLLKPESAIAANIHGSDLIRPFKIIRRGKYRIGVIGLAETWIPYRTMELEPLSFSDEQEALSSAIIELKKANVDAIILARHGGQYFRNGSIYELMKLHPEIDLVLGGHSHEQVSGKKIASGFFVQAGARGEFYALVQLIFDSESRKLKRITSKLLPLNGKVQPNAFDSHPISDKSLPSANVDVATLALNSMLRVVPTATAAALIMGKKDFSEGKTHAALFARFPFYNQLWTLSLTQDEFKKLQQDMVTFLPNYQAFHWLERTPNAPIVTLVLPDYDLSGSGRENSPLRRLHHDHQMRKQHLTLFDAVLAFLRSN